MPDVAFTPGEQLAQQRRRALVDDDPNLAGADLLTRIEVIEEHARHGAYHDEHGTAHVWVDDAPSDPLDPAGHFECYDPDTHGDPYHPIPSLRGTPPTPINAGETQ